MKRLAAAGLAGVCLLSTASTLPVTGSAPVVELVRVPGGGLQPQVAMDARGTVHLVYLAGAPEAADVFYVRSGDAGRHFTPPVRVNSQPGSAIAIGTIRGAQIAIGRNGIVHVAWNGSSGARPGPPVNPATGQPGSPMLYARSTDGGSSFEPQRNLIARSTNLDGGGSVAADDRGGVFVAWHGHPADGRGTEDARRVWLARSTDDGLTFDAEVAVSPASTGVCGCCALGIAAGPRDEIRIVYRSATARTHRDIHALTSVDRGATFTSERIHPWEIAACPMSSVSIVPGPGALLAWETDGQVYFERVDGNDRAPHSPPAAGGAASAARKHPRLAAGRGGTLLMVWTEGTSWARGGAVAWQQFGPGGAVSARDSREGLPPWSFAAAIARPEGGYTILY